ncbi:MAG TPA: alpha/beta fold hydrolase [Brevibacterium senegalense]|uniref:Alpha/beta fold hydrolase n=1 Tax=Brevibacterium senegalense TaxID=1033736 RepID=A0A921MF95_9MICO|nr:alpha/beta fold hydrolase [Brevibacterium senegalense]
MTLSTKTVGEGDLRAVFLHGLFGRGRNFTTAAKAIAETHTSTLVDLPNHGDSAWTDEFSYVDMADAVADTLRQGAAANGPVDLIGHSMGGKTAMVLALRHPDLIDSLVIVDISPVASDNSGEFDHLLGSLKKLDLTALSSRTDADEQLQEPIPNAGTRGFLLQNLRSTDDGYAWQPNLDLLHASLRQIGGFPDLTGSTFDGPTLWVGGSESGYITDEAEPTMRELFPVTRRVTVKGSGHWVHSEKPQEFASILQAFLAR